MNQKAPYERLIAGKLEALPVPDMADAIWARIEAQLDTDLPADDGDKDLPEVPAGGGSQWSQALLFVTVVAVMSLFTIPKKTISTAVPSAIETTAPAPLNAATAQPPPVTQNISPSPAPSNLPFAGASQTGPADSTATITVLPGADTVIASNPVVQQPSVIIPAVQDSKPRKRPRGVSGIGDADYRIVPKKDSSGGGH